MARHSGEPDAEIRKKKERGEENWMESTIGVETETCGRHWTLELIIVDMISGDHNGPFIQPQDGSRNCVVI